MFSITHVDKDKIDYFEREAKIISIFLASRLDKSTIEWLFYGWQDLHQITGYSWHLLVPTYRPINDKRTNMTSDNFDSQLALDILDTYKIDRRSAPCLVFDDLNEESHQHYVSLQGKSETDLRDFVFNCAEIIESNPYDSGATNAGAWRTQVIAQIFNRSQAKKFGKGAMRILPFVGTVSKFISGIPR